MDTPEPMRKIDEPAGKIVVELGESYKNKVYFNIESKNSIKTVNPHNWDIAFECAPNKYGVTLNTQMALLSVMLSKIWILTGLLLLQFKI